MSKFYEGIYQQKCKSFIDAFIREVNDDHVDVISIPRDVACHMRDEIIRLRVKAKETPVAPEPTEQ